MVPPSHPLLAWQDVQGIIDDGKFAVVLIAHRDRDFQSVPAPDAWLTTDQKPDAGACFIIAGQSQRPLNRHHLLFREMLSEGDYALYSSDLQMIALQMAADNSGEYYSFGCMPVLRSMTQDAQGAPCRPTEGEMFCVLQATPDSARRYVRSSIRLAAGDGAFPLWGYAGQGEYVPAIPFEPPVHYDPSKAFYFTPTQQHVLPDADRRIRFARIDDDGSVVVACDAPDGILPFGTGSVDGIASLECRVETFCWTRVLVDGDELETWNYWETDVGYRAQLGLVFHSVDAYETLQTVDALGGPYVIYQHLPVRAGPEASGDAADTQSSRPLTWLAYVPEDRSMAAPDIASELLSKADLPMGDFPRVAQSCGLCAVTSADLREQEVRLPVQLHYGSLAALHGPQMFRISPMGDPLYGFKHGERLQRLAHGLKGS